MNPVDRAKSEETPTAHGRKDRRALWVAVIVLVAAVAVAFGHVLGPDEGLFYRDHILFFRPTWGSIHQQLWELQLPVLNENHPSGIPHELSTNYALFTPATLALIIAPFQTSYDWFVVVHFVILGLGVYALARALGASLLAALTASVAVSLAGPVIAFENLVVGLQGIAWTPWLLWSLHRSILDPSLRSTGLLAMTFALAAQAVMPELMLVDGIGAIALLWLRRRELTARHVGFWGLAGVIGLTMASIDLVPLVDALRGSNRLSGFDYEVSSGWALGLGQLLELVIPAFWTPPEILYFNVPSITGSPHDPPYLSTLYLGTTLGLALSAPWLKERKSRALLLTAAFFLVVAAGAATPLHRIIASLPILGSSRYAIKYVLLSVPAIAVLAAIAISRLEERSQAFVLATGTQAALMIALYSTLSSEAFVEFLAREGRPYVERQVFEVFKSGDVIGTVHAAMMVRVTHALVFAVLLFVVALLHHRLPERRPHLVWVVVAVVGLDLSLAVRHAVPSAPVEYRQLAPEIGKALKGAEHRVLLSAPPPVPHIEGNTPFADYVLNQGQHGELAWDVFRRYDSADLEGLTVSAHHSDIRSGLERLDWGRSRNLLSRAGVGHYIWAGEAKGEAPVASAKDQAGRPVYLYGISEPRPKLSVSAEWQGVTASSTTTLERLSDPDQRDVVLLLDTNDSSELSGSADCIPRLRTVPGPRPESFSAEVESECPTVVVLTEVPVRGYEVWVDQEPAQLLQAEVGYMAVRVPAGTHRVRFEYRSWARRGGGYAVFGLLLALGALFVRPSRARPKKGA